MKSFLKKILGFFVGKMKPDTKDILLVVPEDVIKPVKEVTVTKPKKVRPPRLPRCLSKDKISYNESDAKAKAIQLTVGNQKMRAYACFFCPYWHLTHKKNKLNMH